MFMMGYYLLHIGVIAYNVLRVCEVPSPPRNKSLAVAFRRSEHSERAAYPPVVRVRKHRSEAESSAASLFHLSHAEGY